MNSDGTLGKPSLLATQTHFASVTIALVHSDQRSAIVVKSVLNCLGCRAILLARNGPELLARAAKEFIDICVIDSEVQPDGGAEAVRQLRQCELPFVRSLPVILLGPGNDPETVCAARDAGSNEFVTKPFTAKSLIASVHSVVNSPRPFVISKGFIGPERRASASITTMPPRKEERRQAVPMVLEPAHHVYTGPEDVPKLVLPDYRLKLRMGLKLPEPLVASPQIVEMLEHSLADAKSEFARTVQAQVREIIACNRRLGQKSDRAELTVATIKDLASTIELRTKELGFVRIPEVARLIREFCEQYFIPGNGRSVILLEKHALTLLAMLQGGPEADAGPVGESLLEDLARKVAAFREP